MLSSTLFPISLAILAALSPATATVDSEPAVEKRTFGLLNGIFGGSGGYGNNYGNNYGGGYSGYYGNGYGNNNNGSSCFPAPYLQSSMELTYPS